MRAPPAPAATVEAPTGEAIAIQQGDPRHTADDRRGQQPCEAAPSLSCSWPQPFPEKVAARRQGRRRAALRPGALWPRRSPRAAGSPCRAGGRRQSLPRPGARGLARIAMAEAARPRHRESRARSRIRVVRMKAGGHRTSADRGRTNPSGPSACPPPLLGSHVTGRPAERITLPLGMRWAGRPVTWLPSSGGRAG